jgi:hypothetical protein
MPSDEEAKAKSSSSSEESSSDDSESAGSKSKKPERDNSPVRKARIQLRDHIVNGKNTPADKNALLLFNRRSKSLAHVYLIPAEEMRMSHLELFQCWTHCKNIYDDNDVHVPEYLTYVEADVHDFLLDKWAKYRDMKNVIDIDGNTRLYIIKMA